MNHSIKMLLVSMLYSSCLSAYTPAGALGWHQLLLGAIKSINSTDQVKMIMKGIPTPAKKKATVNLLDQYTRTLLMYAAQNGNLDIVNILLDAGADVNAAITKSKQDGGPVGKTALLYAAQSNNPLVVKRLLDAGANINASQKKSNQTALMYAANKNSPEIVKILLDAGADIDITQKDGTTALSIALANKSSARKEILRLLSNANAKLSSAKIKELSTDIKLMMELIATKFEGASLELIQSHINPSTIKIMPNDAFTSFIIKYNDGHMTTVDTTRNRYASW